MRPVRGWRKADKAAWWMALLVLLVLVAAGLVAWRVLQPPPVPQAVQSAAVLSASPLPADIPVPAGSAPAPATAAPGVQAPGSLTVELCGIGRMPLRVAPGASEPDGMPKHLLEQPLEQARQQMEQALSAGDPRMRGAALFMQGAGLGSRTSSTGAGPHGSRAPDLGPGALQV